VNRGPQCVRIYGVQRKLITFITVALVALGLAACGSSSKSSSTTATTTGSGGSTNSTTADITIGPGLKFTVNKSVKPGAIVTVQNTDSTTHTVASDTQQFSTGNIDPGKMATFNAPSTAGSYKFHCAIHGTAMTGTLTVTS
jgi:plastocyanin